MKIIHTSDLHIDSPLTSRLSEAKRDERRRELLYNFERLTLTAREIGARIIIIAGDLFDTERVTARAKSIVLSCIERSGDIAFLYLPGNHERDALLGESLPCNLKVFGKEWTYFETSDILFAGRSECEKNMFNSLVTKEGKKTVVVLHGEPSTHSAPGGKIGLSEIPNKKIDYLALGHYHSYSRTVIDGATFVFCGTPEGRGFDEVGEKGFSLIEYDGEKMIDSFIPFAKRKLHEIRFDIHGIYTTAELEDRVDECLRAIPRSDLVRLTLCGSFYIRLTKNTDGLTRRYSHLFYYFEIKDESRPEIQTEDFVYDKSLRGEFVRLVLADESLGEEEKQKIIRTGLCALDGDIEEELFK